MATVGNPNQEYKKYRDRGGDASFKEFVEVYNQRVMPNKVESDNNFYASAEDKVNLDSGSIDPIVAKKPTILGMQPFQFAIIVVVSLGVYVYYQKTKAQPAI